MALVDVLLRCQGLFLRSPQSKEVRKAYLDAKNKLAPHIMRAEKEISEKMKAKERASIIANGYAGNLSQDLNLAEISTELAVLEKAQLT